MIDMMNNINSTKQDIDEWKVLDETNEQGQHYLAHRYNILTTSYVCYAVYEPSALMGNHSSITHDDTYGWLGDITTRRLPDSLEALPAWSVERSTAVTAYLDGWKAFAESLIRSAFPQDFDTFPTDAELRVFYNEAHPYYEASMMPPIPGKPDLWDILANVHRCQWGRVSWTGTDLPFFENREDALRALAIVTMVNTFFGFMAREVAA